MVIVLVIVKSWVFILDNPWYPGSLHEESRIGSSPWSDFPMSLLVIVRGVTVACDGEVLGYVTKCGYVVQ